MKTLFRVSLFASFLIYTAICEIKLRSQSILCVNDKCDEISGKGRTRIVHPSPDADLLTFRRDEPFTIYGKSQDGKYFYVQLNKKLGFVNAEHVTEEAVLKPATVTSSLDFFGVGGGTGDNSQQLPEASLNNNANNNTPKDFVQPTPSLDSVASSSISPESESSASSSFIYSSKSTTVIDGTTLFDDDSVLTTAVPSPTYPAEVVSKTATIEANFDSSSSNSQSTVEIDDNNKTHASFERDQVPTGSSETQTENLVNSKQTLTENIEEKSESLPIPDDDGIEVETENTQEIVEEEEEIESDLKSETQIPQSQNSQSELPKQSETVDKSAGDSSAQETPKESLEPEVVADSQQDTPAPEPVEKPIEEVSNDLNEPVNTENIDSSLPSSAHSVDNKENAPQPVPSNADVADATNSDKEKSVNEIDVKESTPEVVVQEEKPFRDSIPSPSNSVPHSVPSSPPTPESPVRRRLIPSSFPSPSSKPPTQPEVKPIVDRQQKERGFRGRLFNRPGKLNTQTTTTTPPPANQFEQQEPVPSKVNHFESTESPILAGVPSSFEAAPSSSESSIESTPLVDLHNHQHHQQEQHQQQQQPIEEQTPTPSPVSQHSTPQPSQETLSLSSENVGTSEPLRNEGIVDSFVTPVEQQDHHNDQHQQQPEPQQTPPTEHNESQPQEQQQQQQQTSPPVEALSPPPPSQPLNPELVVPEEVPLIEKHDNSPPKNTEESSYPTSDTLEYLPDSFQENLTHQRGKRKLLTERTAFLSVIMDILPDEVELFLENSNIAIHTILLTTIVGFCYGLTNFFIRFIASSKKENHLKEINNQIQRKMFYYEAEKNKLLEEISFAREKLSSLDRDNNSITTHQRQMEFDSEELKKENHILRKENAVLKIKADEAPEMCSKLDALITDFEKSKIENRELQMTIEDLEKETETQKNKLKELEETSSQHQKHVNEKGAKVSELSKKIDELEMKLKDSEQNFEVIEAENLNLKTTLNTLNEENRNLKDEVLSLTENRDELSEQIQNNLDAQKCTDDKLKKLNQDLEAKNFEIMSMQSLLSKLNETRKRSASIDTNGNGDALDGAIHDNVSLNDEQESEHLQRIVQLQLRISNLGMEKEQLENKLDTLEKEHNELKEKQKASKDTIKNLKEETDSANKDRLKAVTELEVLSKYYKEKELEYGKEIGVQRVKREMREEDANSIQARMDVIEEENDLLKTQLKSTKKELEESERNFKSQLNKLEKESHENWIAARNSERKFEESKAEATALRQALSMSVKSPAPSDLSGMGMGFLDDSASSIDIDVLNGSLPQLPPPPPPPPLMMNMIPPPQIPLPPVAPMPDTTYWSINAPIPTASVAPASMDMIQNSAYQASTYSTAVPTTASYPVNGMAQQSAVMQQQQQQPNPMVQAYQQQQWEDAARNTYSPALSARSTHTPLTGHQLNHSSSAYNLAQYSQQPTAEQMHSYYVQQQQQQQQQQQAQAQAQVQQQQQHYGQQQQVQQSYVSPPTPQQPQYNI